VGALPVPQGRHFINRGGGALLAMRNLRMYSYEDKLNAEVKNTTSINIYRYENINNKKSINTRAEIYQNQGNSKRVTAQIFNNFRLW
jgi:hypothetical protein